MNFRTSYDFTAGALKGVGVALRWADRPIVRFVAPTATTGSVVAFGDRQVFADLNLGYSRKFTLFRRNVNWSLQLNVDNALNDDKFVVLRQNTAGEILNYRFNEPRQWILTNRFTF